MAADTWCEITTLRNPDSTEEDYKDDLDILNIKSKIEAERQGSNDFLLVYDEPMWTSWIQFERDAIIESKKYPNILFQVHTEDDVERVHVRTYFLNGKTYDVVPELVYPEFDKSKLK